jgi:hypothetical protein
MTIQNITPVAVPDPLSDFEKIGYNTYIHTAESFSPQAPLILLFSWNAAAAKNIAKYTVAYQRLFPSACIVLIRCGTKDMAHRVGKMRKLLTPAFDAVEDHVASGGEVLVHSFSNGGGNQVWEMAKLWKHNTGKLLPMRAQILDSSPGKGTWEKNHTAITFSMPNNWFWKIVGPPAAHILLFFAFISDTLSGKGNKIFLMYQQLNDPALFDTRAPRVYLYSKADNMVGADEVEEHADAAAAKGWSVQKVQFENSPHAGHIREDEGKYWSAIKDAWDRGSRKAGS